MANTITIAHSIVRHRVGSSSIDVISRRGGIVIPQTGTVMASGPQSFTDTASALNVGNLTTIGYGVFENLDPNDFIQLGWDDTGFVTALKLMPLGLYTIPLDPSRTWQGKADTGATVLLDYKIMEV